MKLIIINVQEIQISHDLNLQSLHPNARHADITNKTETQNKLNYSVHRQHISISCMNLKSAGATLHMLNYSVHGQHIFISNMNLKSAAAKPLLLRAEKKNHP